MFEQTVQFGDGTNNNNEQCEVMTYVELGQPAVLEIGELDQPTHSHVWQGNHLQSQHGLLSHLMHLSMLAE
jgi:hypothetical protein